MTFLMAFFPFLSGLPGVYEGGVLGMAFVGTVCSAASAGGINVVGSRVVLSLVVPFRHRRPFAALRFGLETDARLHYLRPSCCGDRFSRNDRQEPNVNVKTRLGT